MGGGDGDERQMMPVEGRTCCGPVKYLLPFWCVHCDFFECSPVDHWPDDSKWWSSAARYSCVV